jgi:hypothetical protein
MFTLPILPEELRVDLTKVEMPDEKGNPVTLCKYPGVVAYVQPLDLVAGDQWREEFPPEKRGANGANQVAMTALVRSQLRRIEGLEMKDADGARIPFDVSKPRHFESLPPDMRNVLYIKIIDRATLSETDQKNSDSPSDSGGTRAMEASPVEGVTSGLATV